MVAPHSPPRPPPASAAVDASLHDRLFDARLARLAADRRTLHLAALRARLRALRAAVTSAAAADARHHALALTTLLSAHPHHQEGARLVKGTHGALPTSLTSPSSLALLSPSLVPPSAPRVAEGRVAGSRGLRERAWPLPSAMNPPPLVAKLYFREELEALFTSEGARVIGPPPREVSLEAARRAYQRHLVPRPRAIAEVAREAASHGTHADPEAEGRAEEREEAVEEGAGWRPRDEQNWVHAKDGAKDGEEDGKEGSRAGLRKVLNRRLEVHGKARVGRKGDRVAPAFQRRTYYAGMTPEDELRAPVAPWYPVGQGVLAAPPLPLPSVTTPPHGYGYSGYRVDAQEGEFPVLTGPGGGGGGDGHSEGSALNGALMLNFGFQKQTNYPIRRTWQKRANHLSAGEAHSHTRRLMLRGSPDIGRSAFHHGPAQNDNLLTVISAQVGGDGRTAENPNDD